MLTNKQRKANQQNAKRSTGPKTASGKARSSQNAIKHGLRAARAIIPGEDPAEYEALHRSFHQACRPRDAIEAALTRQMADAEWRLQRLSRAETGMFWHQYNANDPSYHRDCPNVELPVGDDQWRTYRLGRALQYLTSDAGHLTSLSRYEATVRKSFFEPLKVFKTLRQIEPEVTTQIDESAFPVPATDVAFLANPAPPPLPDPPPVKFPPAAAKGPDYSVPRGVARSESQGDRQLARPNLREGGPPSSNEPLRHGVFPNEPISGITQMKTIK